MKIQCVLAAISLFSSNGCATSLSVPSIDLVTSTIASSAENPTVMDPSAVPGISATDSQQLVDTLGDHTWNNLPIALPHVSVQTNEETFVVLETPAKLPEIAEYFKKSWSTEGWAFVEGLYAQETQFDGEAIFLRFWRGEQSNCVLAGTVAGDSETSVSISSDCSAVRRAADELRTTAWALPDDQEWITSRLPEFELSYPATWVKDEAFFKQPFCNMNEIRCLAGYKVGAVNDAGLFSIISRPRANSQNLEELTLEAERSGIQNLPSPVLIAVDEIKLNDGRPAIYIMHAIEANGQPGFVISLYTVSEDEFFIVSGTIISANHQDEWLEEAIAVTLSLQITEE